MVLKDSSVRGCDSETLGHGRYKCLSGLGTVHAQTVSSDSIWPWQFHAWAHEGTRTHVYALGTPCQCIFCRCCEPPLRPRSGDAKASEGPGSWHALSRAACPQWATMVVIEQMQRWRCPTYTPRTTVIAPYSSTEVVHALPEAEKSTLLFFRYTHKSSLWANHDGADGRSERLAAWAAECMPPCNVQRSVAVEGFETTCAVHSIFWFRTRSTSFHVTAAAGCAATDMAPPTGGSGKLPVLANAGKYMRGAHERDGFTCRGDCEPPVPANVGKYMRARTVATLRGVHEEESKRMLPDTDEYDPDAAGDDLNVCCHGRSAAEEVSSLAPAPIGVPRHLCTRSMVGSLT